MNTLEHYCRVHNFGTPAAARASILYARRFTQRFAEVEHLPAPRREVELLRLQFPTALQPPQSGDLLAGRILYPCVGISPEPCGLGWFFDFQGIHDWMACATCSADEAEEARTLIRFWETRITQVKVRAAYPPELAARLPTDDWFNASDVGFPLYRMAGTVLDYGKLLERGLDGLVPADPEPDSLFSAAREAIGVLQSSIDFYAAQPETPDDLREVLRSIRHQPPRTFREALQLFWLWAIHSGTWNYGRLDIALGPFLARDLDAGRVTKAAALDLLCSQWRLMHAYTNQYNNRVIIGGQGRPDEAAADRFALLAIKATRRVRLNQPQLSLRFYREQNPLLWERALDAIAEGCTFPMLYNDDVNIPAVATAFKVDTATAERYTPYGCGEYVLGSSSVGTPSGVVNLLKALEVALHGGRDPRTDRPLVATPPVEALDTFDKVWRAYAAVLEPYIAALAEQEKIEYAVAGREAAFLYLTILSDDSMARGKGIFTGGIRHLGGTLETYGNNNTADSLYVIDELVFRQQEISLAELVAALDANFEGHDELRRRCLAVAKYGNDEATADAMARRVHEHVCRATRQQAARVGLDSYQVVVINNWANVVLGRCVGASAEGRLAGDTLANGNNPSPGSDRSGPTAFLNSLIQLDPSLHAGAVQNMKFTKEWFHPENRPKFDALLRTYFAQGGAQAMITVVSRDDLESAMREPEKWGHLLVRVGGFSIRFIDLPHDAQMEVLHRTLH